MISNKVNICETKLLLREGFEVFREASVGSVGALEDTCVGTCVCYGLPFKNKLIYKACDFAKGFLLVYVL